MEESVDILLDMVSDPLFKQEDLVPERDVVHEEYRRSIDSANQFAFMTLQQQSFTAGYQHPILGSESHIKNFSREQLLKFRKDHYNAQNALLVISGDLKNQDKMQKLVEKYRLPDGKQSHFPNFELKTKSIIDVHKKPVRMAQINMAIQGAALQSQYAASEDLALNCLGHGETSPFHKELVMKDSLASQAVSSTLFMNHGSVHFIKIVTPYKNIQKTLDRIQVILKKILKEGFVEEELQRIKNQYIASKVYEMESLESFAFSLGHSYAQTGDINSEENFIKAIKHTSRDQVNESFHAILKRPIHLSIQIPEDGDHSKTLKSLKDFSKNLEQIPHKASGPKKAKELVTLSKFDPQVRLTEILPGVKLLYRQNTMNPTFVLHAYLQGGLTRESKKTNGSHHLITALLTKGHKGCDYTELKEILESTSTSFNGFAGKNAYGLTMHGQSEHFSLLANHFLNSLFRPTFSASILKHEKNITLRNLEAQQEDPVRRCFQIAGKVFFGSHSYHQNILGTPESVKNLKRADLLDGHLKNVLNEPILFTYCGDLSFDEVKNQILKFVPQGATRKNRASKKKAIKKSVSKVHHLPFKREQTHLLHGIQTGPINAKEQTVLKMLTTHLSGQSSELFVEVRDRQGLCYSAQPIHFSALEAGYWGIYMGTGNEKVGQAIKAIKAILLNIKKHGLRRDEFDRIKLMIEGQTLINVQTNDDFANVYSVPAFQGLGLDHYHQEILDIMNLGYDDFQKQLTRLLGRPWATIIVGELN